MSEYIVSARKYRPMTFSSVVGQSSIATTLKNAIHSGKLAHAYLFCGPRGVGKTTCARIFAKTINCLNPREDGEACNACESCLSFNEQRSLNIHELDAASNNSVDDIRNLIDQVRIPPQIGKYKVFIIDEVHMLSTAAFNAFLKTLEEPPAHAVFILATTEKHKILPTILSRCQIYDFQRMTIENTVAHLAHVAEQEGYTYEPAALNVIAQKADGGMRDALSIFDQVVSYTGGNITYQQVIENLNVLDYDYYFRLVDLLLEKKISESLLLYNEILAKGFEGGPFISGLASHLRDLLVSRDPQTAQLLEASDDIRKRYVEQAQRCRPQWLYRAIRLCNDCDQAYRTSRNKRLQVELTLIETAQATDDEPSAGRRPVRILRPIFSLLTTAAAASEAPVAASPATVSTTSTTSTLSSVAPAKAPTTTAQSLQHAQPSQGRPDVTLPPKPASATAKPQLLNLDKLAPSIGHLRSKRTATPAPAQSVASATPAKTEQIEDKPFTLEDVLLQWQVFIQHLPQADTALAQNMRIMQPRLSDDSETTILLDIENEDIASMLTPKLPELQQFLQKELRNSQVSINCQVVKREQTAVRSYDKRQQLRHFCELNPSLISLGKAFKLELT
ncbi:MAG: DNA polymerase III subunit gamma/tau [Bacteroidaceae bacterium]|nr:DNA polymerase III subunit gamma/tau [Bacteroidaceae bacterium]